MKVIEVLQFGLKLHWGLEFHISELCVCFSSQTPRINSDFPQIRLLEKVQQSGNMHEPSLQELDHVKVYASHWLYGEFFFWVLGQPALSVGCSDSGLYFNM